jgi:hypothetical protein
MPPFLFGAAMRYLSVLLLSPSLAYAACAPGVNYGSLGINSPSPICIAYSGSSLGGCSAYCGGGAGSTVCVELPIDTPPSKGPYFSDGNECEIGGGGDNGGDNGGGDGGTGGDGGAPYYYPFKNQVSPIGVGGQYQEATTRALKQIDEDIRWSAIKFYEQGEASLATFKGFSADLRKVTDALNTQIIGSEQVGLINNQMLSTLNRSEDWLQELTLCITRPLDYNCRHLAGSSGGGSSGDTKALVSMMGSAMGMWASTQGNTYSTNDTLGYVNRELGAFRDQSTTIAREQLGLQKTISDDLSAIRDALKNGSGSGGEGGEGDKPCTGPLCSFTKPSSSSGSALSRVFSNESIDDVKKQIENKDTEISDAMNNIKSVFAPEELTITGTYNNDYHDINGVRVDLSGKSNLELFFNSGPKMAIWFLAVLLAFSILMGGRKNA